MYQCLLQKLIMHNTQIHKNLQIGLQWPSRVSVQGYRRGLCTRELGDKVKGLELRVMFYEIAYREVGRLHQKGLMRDDYF